MELVMDFIQKLKESANGLHDGMGGHADYCADLMQSAAAIIKDLFADANRYRYIRDKERLHIETEDGEAIMSTTFSSADEFDEAVDQAMEDAE
jgi:hypothetical protein